MLYSERFLHLGAPNVLMTWVCPAGRRAVIRSVVISNGGAAGGFARVTLAAKILMLPYPDGYTTLAWDMRQVVYGGEDVVAFVNQAGMTVAISGYLFADSGSSTALEVTRELAVLATPYDRLDGADHDPVLPGGALAADPGPRVLEA